MSMYGLGGWGPRHPWGDGQVIAPMVQAVGDNSYGKIDLTYLIGEFYGRMRYGERLKRGRDAQGRPDYVIMPERPPGGAAAAPAAPAGRAAGAAPGYSRESVYVDPRISRLARDYANKHRDTIARNVVLDARGLGLNFAALPSYMMDSDPDGSYKGRDIAVNEDLKYHADPLEFSAVGSHEIIEAEITSKTGTSTEKAHRIARALETPMAVEYALGRRGVARKYAEIAMEMALQN